MDRRSDYKTALMIDAVVHDAGDSRVRAARQLAEMGVPMEVAMRVLTRPAERRSSQPVPEHPDIGRWRRES